MWWDQGQPHVLRQAPPCPTYSMGLKSAWWSIVDDCICLHECLQYCLWQKLRYYSGWWIDRDKSVYIGIRYRVEFIISSFHDFAFFFFSMCVQSCPTLWPHGLKAHQNPLSMEFSRQEYWSRFPFFFSPGDLPNPGIKPMSPALAGGLFTMAPPGNIITIGQYKLLSL